MKIKITVLRIALAYSFCFLCLFTAGELFAASPKIINLSDLQNTGLQAVNRDISYVDADGKKFISLQRTKGEGLLWLPVEDLKNGIIEISMRGTSEFQRSFIGVAFHGVNDSTFDAVYCRPFNFPAEDPVIRSRAIQYVSQPVFTWEKLRTELPGIFEKEIINAPDPTGWFRMKLVINDKTVQAYINDNESPSLVVEKQSNISSGKVGIFVADNSGGDFEKVSIEYK